MASAVAYVKSDKNPNKLLPQLEAFRKASYTQPTMFGDIKNQVSKLMKGGQ